MFKKQLEEKREELKLKMSELLDNAKKETRALNDDEVAKFDEYEKEVRSINATLDRMEEERSVETKSSDDTTVEQREAKQFVDYIRGIVLEKRTDVNLTVGANGAIIPHTIAQKIITKAYDMCTILAKTTKYNTKGNLSIPTYNETTDNKVNMAYADEFVELESNVGSFGSIDLGNFLSGALVKLSKSLIANSDIDVENVIINQLSEAIARFMEHELLYGTDGKVEGLKGVTQTITTASSTAITVEDLIKLKNKIKKRFRGNAVWIMSNDTLTALELLKDKEDRFVFREDLTGEFDGYILGYPVEVSDNMEEIGSGKTVIYFGDYSGLALKQRTDALELNVLREKYATQHAVGINAWLEFDSKVENAQKIAKLTMAV